MTVFVSTLDQMGFLLLLIAIGYVLVRCKVVSAGSEGLLSKLESYVFIPALTLGTFMQNFTVERLGTAWQFLLCGLVLIVATIPIALGVSRVATRDPYLRKIYTYGLAFSNFGFMGNAVVEALFPQVFMEYLIFVLPFWVFIYMWGVPALLIPAEDNRHTLKDRLLTLVNPMFIAMVVGILLGLIQPPLPSFISRSVTTLGSCMSPVAMLLTGMTIAHIDLRKTFRNLSIYAVSLVRLVALPLAGILLLTVLPLSYELALCAVCALAMPLGLNTIVVPSAYGKDTSVAAGMALISHLLSCITIPLIFLLFQHLFG